MEIIGLLVRTAPVDNADHLVLEVLVILTTEILGLLVRIAPVDDANDPIIKVLWVGRCPV